MNARSLTFVTIVAVGGGLAYQLGAPWLAAIGPLPGSARPRGTFQVRDVEWKRTEWPPSGTLGTHVSYDGKARIVGTGELASGRYLVLFQVIRSRRVNPATPQDTIANWVPFLGSGATIMGQDWAFTCTPLERQLGDSLTYCAQRLQEPEARFRVAGWVKLDGPPTSGPTRR